MLSAQLLSPADRAFLLILIVFILGACFVWLFWEAEQAQERRRQRLRIVADARRFMLE